MQIEPGVSLKPYNTFGLPAVAGQLVRIRSEADVRAVVDHPELGLAPKFVLGGGSNVILTRDMPELVLKVEILGKRLVAETDRAVIVEFGAERHGDARIGERLRQLLFQKLQTTSTGRRRVDGHDRIEVASLHIAHEHLISGNRFEILHETSLSYPINWPPSTRRICPVT